MTKKIIQFLQTIFITTTLFSLASTSVFADRPPDEVTDRTDTPVPIDRSTTITGFFSYGRVTNDLDIEDAVGQLTISGNDFEFIPTAFEDWYYGDPNRADSDGNTPDQPVCNSSYSGPKYPISPSLANSTSLTYGLQSARDSENPSGSSDPAVLNIPDRTGTIRGLRERHTGCIKFEIKVSPNATVGSTTEIIFDQDFLNSPTYTSSTRPPRQVLRLQIGPANNPIRETPVSEPEEDPTEEGEEDSSFEEELPRTGGIAVFGGLSLVALSIVAFIVHKVKRNNIKKIELN